MFKNLDSLVVFIGRVLVGGLFLYSGINSAIGYENFINATGSSELLSVAPVFFGVSGILIKIFCGGFLLLGIFPRLSALGLFVFCIMTAILFHFPETQSQAIAFSKNLMIAGGMLAFVAFGSGKFSIYNKF